MQWFSFHLYVLHFLGRTVHFGLSTGRRGYLYPAWQFGPEGMLPGLARVLAAIRTPDPWAKLVFMVNPNDRLGGESPVEVLRRQGESDLGRVLEAASAYGEHGAA